MNAKCERTSMDLSKSMADKSCRIPPIGAARASAIKGAMLAAIYDSPRA
jgi:hypothetical protein